MLLVYLQCEVVPIPPPPKGRGLLGTFNMNIKITVNYDIFEFIDFVRDWSPLLGMV